MAIKKGASANEDEGGTQEEEPTEDELEKALDLLEEAAQSPEDEKDTLLKKALDGTIDEEENDRLLVLMGGGGDEDPSLAKSIVAPMEPENNEKLQKSLNVSPYLDGMHEATKESLENLADFIEKSDNRQHNFNVILAKGVRAIGELLKSVDTRLEVVEDQPVARPRAMRSTKQKPHMEKSFAGEDGGEKLSKSQVLDTLESMHIESLEKGNGGMAICGEDLNKAITKYESTRRLSRPMFEELKNWRANKQAA